VEPSGRVKPMLISSTARCRRSPPPGIASTCPTRGGPGGIGPDPPPRRRGRLRVDGRLGEGCGAAPRRRGRPARLPDAGGGRTAGTRPWGGPPPVQQPPPPAGPAAGGTRSGCGVGDGDVAHAVILG
jgi:hypothetical protein